MLPIAAGSPVPVTVHVAPVAKPVLENGVAVVTTLASAKAAVEVRSRSFRAMRFRFAAFP
jgi:hypothetical protein